MSAKRWDGVSVARRLSEVPLWCRCQGRAWTFSKYLPAGLRSPDSHRQKPGGADAEGCGHLSGTEHRFQVVIPQNALYALSILTRRVALAPFPLR